MQNTELSPVSLKHGASDQDFLKLRPVVERHARFVFRRYDEEKREEATAEAVAAAFVSFLKLNSQGRNASLFPSSMAVYAVLHVKNDRHVGSRANSRDVFSRKTQRRRGFRVESFPEGNGTWPAAFADNSSPIPDQVAMRIDLPVFLQSLSQRERQMALLLVDGWQAKQVAQVFNLSPPRLCQIRRKWYEEWIRFHGE